MLKIQKYLNRLLSNKDRERYQILKTLKNSQFFPRVEIEKNQISKLNMLLLHAYKNVPYYQNIFNKEGGSGKPYINIKSLDDIKPVTGRDNKRSRFINSNKMLKWLQKDKWF